MGKLLQKMFMQDGKMIVQTSKVYTGLGIMVVGLLFCLTLVGIIIGLPLIIVGLLVMGSGIRCGVSEEDKK